MGARSQRLTPLNRGWWLWILIVALVAVGYEHYLRPAIARSALPTGDAQWIWADVDPHEGWVGFFAVHDFQIDVIPPESTVLTVMADEEYVVFLNGHAVGSGQYRPGTPLDAYDVSSILVEGENRLLVELRSAHSVGGLLLSVASGDRTLAITDGSWSVLDEYREDAKWPGAVTGEMTPVTAWGRPPTGRWGRLDSVVGRPRLQGQLLSRQPLPATSVRLDGNGGWQSIPPEPDRESPLGRWVTFDFGREVSGFLNVVPARRGAVRGLFWIATEGPPDPRSSPPEGRLFTMVGQGSWTDAVPRRFRYVTVVSLAQLAGARAFVLKPELESKLLSTRPEPQGVLGLKPPDLRSPVEDEFWREFESLASVGSGEDS